MIAINNWVGVYVSYFFPYTGHCTDVRSISHYELRIRNVWELSELGDGYIHTSDLLSSCSNIKGGQFFKNNPAYLLKNNSSK